MNISHADLKKITAPVLLMVGDRDNIINEHPVEMFKEIPKVQLFFTPGLMHGAPRNNPETFNAIALLILTEHYDYETGK